MIHLPNIFNDLKNQNVISELEYEFVRFLQQQNPEESQEVLLAAALCIQLQNEGHICLDFDSYQNEKVFSNEKNTGYNFKNIRLQWLNALKQSALVSKTGELKPLILEDNRLYIHRFWKYERELAQWLISKSSQTHKISKEAEEALTLFISQKNEISEQDIALILSFMRDLLVITGGPGTGKTFTVLKIIAAHNHFHKGNLNVAIAAPTGKASRRLTESIQEGKQNLDAEIKDKINISDDALTVHKLLGADYQGSKFRYNKENKLPYDIIIVDEASMLDINLWVNLIRAIPESAKLIVLGDKDQLASVEAGSILGDICGGENTFSDEITHSISKITGADLKAENHKPAINDSVVFLNKSYRFGENSGIKLLADAINNKDENQVMELLKSSDYPDVQWLNLSSANLETVMERFAVNHFHYYSQLPKEEMFKEKNQKKILCALRRGSFGSGNMNKAIESNIRTSHNIGNTSEWYSGRMIMATRNDNLLKIRNGEIGICEMDSKSQITFEGENAQTISAARLTDYEPAYAITIHKSQGSEFDDVAIILPEKQNQVLSKEILYTSVTRARQNTLIVGNEDIIRYAVGKTTSRHSGLRKRIWN